jgi:hypothetical protein
MTQVKEVPFMKNNPRANENANNKTDGGESNGEQLTEK